jgi:hypothetical protein
MTSTGIYRSIVVELERQRHARGYSMDVMSELMGVAERSYAKMVHPDTASGRQASWDKLQKAVDVLFCEGFEVVIRKGGVAVEMGPGTKRLIRHSAAHFDSRTQRELMREIGLKGASNGGNMRARKLGVRRRKEIAKKAGLASAAARSLKRQIERRGREIERAF